MKTKVHADPNAQPRLLLVLVLGLLGLALGCKREVANPLGAGSPPSATEVVPDEIQEALAQLSPADRQLALAQQYCPVMAESRLGEMGPPIKLDIQGQTVFICCKGCQSKALREADQTLAKVAQLKARRR